MRKIPGLLGFLIAGAAHAAAPVANDDSYQTGQGQMMTIAAPGVLGNDSDADAGDTLSASVVSNPMFGTLTLNADGSFTYNPDADFYGSDSFSYAAGDGTASDSAVVSLTVTPSYGGGAGGGGGYGYGSGSPSPAVLALLALAAFYRRGLKASKRRCISP